jgi:DNA-binding NarL/FixJ family response regulator
MGPIWIATAHCARGHVVAAMAIDVREIVLDDADKILRAEIRRRVSEGEADAYCSMCADSSMSYKVTPSDHLSLREAASEATRLESRQVEARELVRAYRSRTIAAARAPLRPIDDLL